MAVPISATRLAASDTCTAPSTHNPTMIAIPGTSPAMALGARRMPEPMIWPTATATPKGTPRIFRRSLRGCGLPVAAVTMPPESFGALLHDDLAGHAHHAVHEVRAPERIGAGLLRGVRDVGGFAAVELNGAILDPGLIFGRDRGRGEKFGRAEIVALAGVVAEMQPVGVAGFQGDGRGTEGIAGERDIDRLRGRLRLRGGSGQKQHNNSG